MSLPGRPKGEYRSAQHEGTPVSRGMGERVRAHVLAHHTDPLLARRFIRAVEGARR
jgi:hypothetical protein